MALSVGSRLGPYELLAKVGSGGMGEVYRARDTRLDREVAVKVLPESFARDQDRLRRFEQEARTVAGLNHPNILALYDVGNHEGSPYLVSELLEGETLRDRLTAGTISSRKCVEILSQVAEGLAAAHEKGVIHRDLKPENIFVTRDQRVKILDFGLAKLATAPSATTVSDGVTAAAQTSPGMVLGTAAYMSPEQVRGREVDARSDIFSFGAVAYEMVSGRRAFSGDSGVETMNAILKDDPPELDMERLRVSPGVERIIRHCLEKEPAHRFQSARDLAFDLTALSNLSGSSAAQAVRASRIHINRKQWILTAALAAVAAVIAVALALSFARQPRLDFQQLTFRRGNVFNARFAPDKSTVIYSAMLGGAADEVYSTVADSRESRPLGLSNAELLAVSSQGELAVLLKPRIIMSGFVRMGTLARVSMVAGTAPREMSENITAADWSPDGSKLAVIRRVPVNNLFQYVLEYPIGTVIYKSVVGGWLSHMRVSPRGDAIALLDHVSEGDDRGKVTILGTDGKVERQGAEFPGIQGLAWTPAGDLWFTGVPDTGVSSRELFSLTRSGKQRVLLIAPGEMTIHDINADGLALITVNNRTRSIVALVNGKESNLEWLDRSVFGALTIDGSTVLFHEGGKAGGSNGQIYLRNVDGSPAVKLADGYSMAISFDKKWVIGLYPSNPPQLHLIPTGAGEIKTISAGNMQVANFAGFTADSKHLLWNAGGNAGNPQTFLSDLDGSNLHPYTQPGTIVVAVAPNGCCEVRQTGDDFVFWNKAANTSEPFKGIGAGTPAGAAPDLSVVYLAERNGGTAKVWAVNWRTGERRPLADLTPHDPTGVLGIDAINVSTDGKTIVYGVSREVSDLYLARPVK